MARSKRLALDLSMSTKLRNDSCLKRRTCIDFNLFTALQTRGIITVIVVLLQPNNPC